MRRALGVVLLGVTLAGCGGGPPPAPPRARATVAMLAALQGAVFLTRDGTRGPAQPGAVAEGDVLETGEGGHALLSGGGREVELLAHSRFRVGASLADLSLDLGELVFLESDAGAFDTSLGRARPGAGGRVTLRIADGGPAFEVGFGTLELLDVADGGGGTLKAGQRFVVGLGVLSMEEAPVAAAPKAAAPTVTLTPQGLVTVKPASGPSARLPAAGTALSERGSFAVDKAGGLRAEAPGAVVRFDGASKGTLEPLEGDAALEAGLQGGTARIFLAAGHGLVLDAKEPLTLRAKTALTALVTATSAGPKIELLGGQAEATLAAGPPRSLEAGDVATLRGTRLDTARRPAPLLALPFGRTTRVYWGRAGEVALSFGPGDGALEVSESPKFETLLVSAEGGDQLAVPAPLKGALYWRRRGEPRAASAHFERDEHAAAASAKSDTVAETGLKATVYFQGAVPSLTFTFPAKPGASAWRFRVYATAELTTPLVDRRVTENRAVVESGALREGSYLWSAVPLSAAGVESSGGRMNKMDIVFDNSVTRLVLSSPKEGERAKVATGVAPLGSTLTLNGKPVTLDGGGRFTAPLDGAPVLQFKLTTKDRAEALWVRRLGR